MPWSVSAPGAERPLDVIIHADDCGLSRGITDAIVGCYDHGWLRRTSVVVNGSGCEHAVAALRERPGLAVALHLNLFEGTPLSDPSEVDLLVDAAGRFSAGFVGLWVRGLAGRDRVRLRAQLRLELRRQIERFLDAFPDRRPVVVDGHVHYHVLPPVFGELLALCEQYPVADIRLPREPFYWRPGDHAPRPPIVNVMKNIVLQALCHRARAPLAACGVPTTNAFIGVLATGAMTLAHVDAALRHLRRAGTGGRIEILFHPGRARSEEASLWAGRPALAAYHLSVDRDREAELLRSDALGEVLRAHGVRAGGAAVSPKSPEVAP